MMSFTLNFHFSIYNELRYIWRFVTWSITFTSPSFPYTWFQVRILFDSCSQSSSRTIYNGHYICPMKKKTQLWSDVDITCRPHQWRGSRLSHSSLRVAEPAYLLTCIWTQWLKRNKLKAHKKKPQLRAGRRLLTAYRLSRCHGGRSIIGFSADLQLLNSCTMVHLPYCVHTCCAYVQHSTCTCKWRCPCVFPRWWTPSRLWKQLRWPFFWFFLCIPLADVSLFFLLLLDLVSYSFAYLVRFLVFILLTEEEETRDSRTTVTTQIYHLLNFDWQPANKIKIKNQAPDKA